MTWIRLEDGYAKGGKHALLSDGAFRLWHEMLSHCAENLTDGFVSDKSIANLACMKALSDAERSARVLELVECKTRPDGVGLCERIVGGWTMHDYLEFQPSRNVIMSRRRKAALKKQKQRERMRTGRKNNGASTTAPSSSTHREMSPQVSPGDSSAHKPRTDRAQVRTGPSSLGDLVTPIRHAKR